MMDRLSNFKIAEGIYKHPVCNYKTPPNTSEDLTHRMETRGFNFTAVILTMKQDLLQVRHMAVEYD